MSLIIVIFAVIGFLTFIFACYAFPAIAEKWTPQTIDKFERLDAGRKTMAQVLGGAALILTFSWSIIKDSSTLEQGRQQEANRQFLEAGKMLSEDKDTIASVTAIYALGDVAVVRPEFHMRVRDILSSYLRNTAQDLDVESNSGEPYKKIRQAQQAALFVLSARDLTKDDPFRDILLNGAYLAGADFFRSKGFSKSFFQGATLYGANFRYSDLQGTHFDGARLGDWQAYGRSWDDEKTPASVNWIEWEKYVYSANFERSNLQDSSFINASLSGAILKSANIARADFSGANLSRADFSGAVGSETAIFNRNGRVACADKPVIGLERNIPKCHGQ